MCTKAAAAAEVGKTAQEEGAILQVGTATTGHGLCFTGKHNKANSARNTTARRVCWHTTRHTESDGGKVAEKARKVLHGEDVRNKHKTRKVFALKCRAKAADGFEKRLAAAAVA